VIFVHFWEVDVVLMRIGEVRVWGGERTQTQQKKLFREQNTGKKDKRLLDGFEPADKQRFQ
jgi:hypothetical protein